MAIYEVCDIGRRPFPMSDFREFYPWTNSLTFGIYKLSIILCLQNLYISYNLTRNNKLCKGRNEVSCLPKEPSAREFNSRFDNYFLHTLKSVVQDFFLLESAVSVLHAEEATEN